MKKKFLPLIFFILFPAFTLINCGSEQLKTENQDLQSQLSNCMQEVDKYAKEKAAEKAAMQESLMKDEETYKQLIDSLKDQIQKNEITIDRYKDALTINIAERILFDFGKAKIKPKYYPVLNKVGAIIKNLPDKFIQVEGYTDNVPIAKDYVWKFPNNWALGAMRAINVTTYFLDHFKLNPHRIAVMSFSKYRPLVPNTSPANRAKNRRIEIVILNQSLYREMERKHGLP